MNNEHLEHRDDFDALIQGAFTEQAATADAHVWENIEAAIQPKKKRVIAWWWYGAAAGVTLLLGYNFLRSTDNSEQLQTPEVADQELLPATNESSNLNNASVDFEASQHAVVETEEDAMDLNTPHFSEEPENEFNGETSLKSERVSDKTLNSLASANPANPEAVDAGNHSGLTPKPIATDADENRDALFAMRTLDATIPLESLDSLAHREYPFVLPYRPMPQQKVEPSEPMLMANVSSSYGSSTNGSNYRGIVNESDALEFGLNETPTAADDVRAEVYEKNYQAPFVFGGRFAYPISPKWYVEMGLAYSRLSANVFNTSQTTYSSYTEVQHFVGVPLMLHWQFLSKRKFGMSLVQGWQIDKGIATRYISETTNYPASSQPDPKGFQLGLTMGLSTEYRFMDQLGLYAQPSITTWSIGSQGVSNIRNQSLLWPEIQLGIRYHLK